MLSISWRRKDQECRLVVIELIEELIGDGGIFSHIQGFRLHFSSENSFICNHRRFLSKFNLLKLFMRWRFWGWWHYYSYNWKALVKCYFIHRDHVHCRTQKEAFFHPNYWNCYQKTWSNTGHLSATYMKKKIVEKLQNGKCMEACTDWIMRKITRIISTWFPVID